MNSFEGTMTPLPFQFPQGLLFWGIFFWAFLPEIRIAQRARLGAGAADSRDAGSMQIIATGQSGAFAVAFVLAWVPSAKFPPMIEAWAFGLGLAFLIGGSLLRRHCWRMLGTHFTGDVRAEEGQPVIDQGAYHWVRHPSYSAAILIHFGIGLALGGWASALILALASIAIYHHRMQIEERALNEVLGERYRNYVRGRKRLIPYLY
jgi:protein-S-isoprenylcysteine O-methyltransferase Ste14